MSDNSMIICSTGLQAYVSAPEKEVLSADITPGLGATPDRVIDQAGTIEHYDDEEVTMVNLPLNFYINSRVGELCNYFELIRALDEAEPGDVINVHLATPGGSLDTAIAIIHAIGRSAARVIAHADAGVSSSGTFIFLACSEWRIYDYSYFMFHDGSVANEDAKKFNETRKQVDFVTKLYQCLANDLYSKIFSTKEIECILDGSDCYLMGEDVKARLINFVELNSD